MDIFPPPLGTWESCVVAGIPAGFSGLHQGWKSQCFWLPQGFVLHGAEIPWSLENQDCPKKPPKVTLWNPLRKHTFVYKRAWAFAFFKEAAQPFGYSSSLSGVDVPCSCTSCSALGTTWLYPKDNSCSLPMATFQHDHFNLSGWQLSGFGDAVIPNFHVLNCCFNTSYLKWWLSSIHYENKYLSEVWVTYIDDLQCTRFSPLTASKSIEHFVRLYPLKRSCF